MTIATITSKGQVTLPKDIRQKLHLDAGEKIDFQVDEKRGIATLVPLNNHVDDVFGMLRRGNRKKGISTAEMDRKVEQQVRREFS